MLWGMSHCRRLTTWRDAVALLIGAKTRCSCPIGVCYPMGKGGVPEPWPERGGSRIMPPANALVALCCVLIFALGVILWSVIEPSSGHQCGPQALPDMRLSCGEGEITEAR